MIIQNFFFALTLFLASASCKRPNIVVILADDLGWGDVSFHGSRQIATPNIDALASDGIILHNFYTTPLCTPTRAALMSGRHPVQLGLQQGVIEGGEPYGLPLGVSILPQWLKQLNYSTSIVGKWHLGFHRRAFLPTQRGFDYHFGYWNAHSDYFSRITWSPLVSNISEKGIDFHRNEEQESVEKYKDIYSTELYTRKSVEVIMNHTQSNKKSGVDKPLFLYLAHQAVHGPYQAPDK